MSDYILIQNSIQSYPSFRVSAYDPVAVKKLLQEFGVTDIHAVSRVDRLPGSIYGAGPREVGHNELCFSMPTQQQFTASVRGAQHPASNVKRALEDEISKLIGGSGRVTLTKWALGAERVYNCCVRLQSYLDVSLEDQGIDATTRDNGDTGEEEPGAEDIAEAKRFAKAIRAEFPNLRVSIDPCDEWVSVSVSFSDINEASLEPVQNVADRRIAP